MKKIFILTSLIFTFAFPVTKAEAQSPCVGLGILGIGPFGIGIVIDCPPPLPPPPPAVVIIRRRRAPKRCSYAAPPVMRRPRRVRRTYVAPVAPATIINSNYSKPISRLFTLGVLMDSASYDDGGLIGGGVYGRYILGQFAAEISFTSLSSCTNCNEFAYREDNRVSTSALFFLNKIKPVGINFYIKGGIIHNTITFYNNNELTSSSYEQTKLEIGGGVEWRLSPWLSLNAEVTGMIGSQDDEEIGHGSLNENMSLGIPSGDQNGGINFRLGIATHF
jgi:hypothetical protein